MIEKDDRMKILDQLEKGEISPEEAAEALERDLESIFEDLDSPMKVLEALESGTISTDEAAEQLGRDALPDLHFADALDADQPFPPKLPKTPKAPEGSLPKMQVISRDAKINLGWIWPSTLGLGMGFVLLSALWMANRINSGAGLDLWFFVAWLPMLIGLLLLAVGWSSLYNPWIQVHVNNKYEDESVHFQFGFPLPKGILRWGVRKYGQSSGRFNFLDVDAMLYKMEHGLSDEPIRIHVDDDDEDVEIVIGHTE